MFNPKWIKSVIGWDLKRYTVCTGSAFFSRVVTSKLAPWTHKAWINKTFYSQEILKLDYMDWVTQIILKTAQHSNSVHTYAWWSEGGNSKWAAIGTISTNQIFLHCDRKNKVSFFRIKPIWSVYPPWHILYSEFSWTSIFVSYVLSTI